MTHPALEPELTILTTARPEILLAAAALLAVLLLAALLTFLACPRH